MGLLDYGVKKSRDREKEIEGEAGWIEKGVSEEVDPLQAKTDQCIKENGEGFVWDPELEMCSYQSE